MENNNRKMKWQIDFNNYFDVYSTFIVDGFIDDVQPIIDEETNQVNYGSVSEFLINKYYETRTESRKCVVVYDPTESNDKRFYIASPYTEELDPESEENDPKYIRTYDNQLAQHFWDIINEEEIEEQMIEHSAGGVSLDMARMHYALTEHGRMGANELIEKFKNFWNIFNSENRNVDGYLFIIKMTSRLLTREGSSNGLGADELMLFRQFLNISQSLENHPEHKIVILANKATDLPMWFIDEIQNPFIKKLTISKPTKENKEAFFDQLIEDYTFGDEFTEKYQELVSENPKFDENIKRKFLAYTNDFTMKGLQNYEKYLQQGNTVEHPDKLAFSLTTFKAGDMKNPWEDEQTVINILNIRNTVTEVIKGQDFAMETVQNILTRAAIGLDRLENPNAPRVVLFLAGPTGTGKTEICKQLAKAIFGSEDRIIRFDMSEYGQEHADQKLFGAPPGYVGYEEGGKLTNAIKKEPFSLVLFDEIEKAHNKILDKFLQILGDGRLTDGHGETVSFTDAIIAITSNAGVTSPTPKNAEEALDIFKKMGEETKPEQEINMKAVIEMEKAGLSEEEIYNNVKEYLRYNVKYYFNCQLGRPELYGRIEDSLVYYNYICSEAVGIICNSKVKKICKAATDEFRLASITCEDQVKEEIIKYCQDEKVRSMGARGIGKAVNKLFNGSLSNFIAPFIRGDNGQRKSDLVGKSLVCYCELNDDDVFTLEDIKWRIQ